MAKKDIYILGISCYYHDSAIALLKNGQLVFAAHEERYSRIKHDESFPLQAIEAALASENIAMEDISCVGFYEKPFYTFFDRILTRFFSVWPRGFCQFRLALRAWSQKKLWIRSTIKKKLSFSGDIFFVPHHLSHAASSYFSSDFESSALLVIDGVGEWATTSIGHASGSKIQLTHEIRYPDSLGLLYSAMTFYLGFKVNSAEYKVMGLAPYGEPKYVDQIWELIDVKEDGSFCLNMKYFTFEKTLMMTGKKMEQLFGYTRRLPEEALEQHHKDIARSLQEVLNECMLRICRYAREITGEKNICLSGGVALNCVANGHIQRSGIFENVFICPASGDAGGSLGVAQYLWYAHMKNKKRIPVPNMYVGDAFSDEDIRSFLTKNSITYSELDSVTIYDEVASLLVDQNAVIGWFQGAMEFGPRALGNRSILADPRDENNWKRVNVKIKFREDFRPFAPIALADKAQQYFDCSVPSPYMLLVCDVHEDKCSAIPAVTHVDGTARLQTISREQNERMYSLLDRFHEKTDCPVLINTSFNVRGEPIVRTPENAYNCFLHTDMDYLVLGSFLLDKKKMDVPQDVQAYINTFELD